jgi:isoquinoline 1-oxidoreductase
MKKQEKTAGEFIQTAEGSGMSRRTFVKLVGGGIIIFLNPFGIFDLFGLRPEPAGSLSKDYNAFLQIAEDGTVYCYTGKIEMGQGIITSLAQMMADELHVSFDKVKMVMGDTDLCPWDQGTWGSQSTRIFSPFMRAAAAEARGVLLELASEKLGVPQGQLEIKDGTIADKTNPRNMVSYAELTKGKKIEKHLDIKPNVDDYTQFNSVGKPYKRRDALIKVTGEAKYTGDMKIPGMMFARILRPPSHGAKMTSVDVSGAEKIEGTQVIHDGDLVAVLHENRDSADIAIAKINAEYSFDEMSVNNETIFDSMLKADSVANEVRSEGDLQTGQDQSVKIIESEFHDPYLVHAAMETHTALAHLEGGKMTVWASTQNPFSFQEALARELGFAPENVRVITPFVGGGFGGKSSNEQAVQAAKLAKLSGNPVMVVWTRDEEFFYDHFHPAGVVKIKSGTDNSGKIKLWDYRLYYSGSRGIDIPYEVPNVRITSYNRGKQGPPVHPFPTGPWRAPNANTNIFARESQIDMMAASSGTDPLEFRLKNLKNEQMITCLKAVADKFGYIPGKAPSGRGIGISAGLDAGTWVAHMAEVKVDKQTGKVKVIRITCVQDMGLCVNPEGATLQMEGSITMGLGYALTEELLFEGGKVMNHNFDTYEIPHFSSLPVIETQILDRKDKAPQGGGEPAIIGIGAVIANAIFDATGARLYRMPFTPKRVLEALQNKF